MPTRKIRASRTLLTSLAMTLAALALVASPASAETEVTTPVVSVDVGVSSVTVDWEPSQSDHEISLYTVRLGTRWHSTTETEATFFLPRDTDYQVIVQAQDAEYNRSEWSDPVHFTTPEEHPVTTPENVQVTTQPGSATVTWEPSESDAGVRDYVVSYGWRNYAKRVTGTTATLVAPPGADLNITVRATDEAYRWSDESEPIPVTVAPHPAWSDPVAPENLRAVLDENGDVAAMAWDAATGGVGELTYHLKISGNEVDSTNELTQSFQYRDIGPCAPGETVMFEMTVTANSWHVESPPSNQVDLC